MRSMETAPPQIYMLTLMYIFSLLYVCMTRLPISLHSTSRSGAPTIRSRSLTYIVFRIVALVEMPTNLHVSHYRQVWPYKSSLA